MKKTENPQNPASFGYFNSDGSEFVIKETNTPRGLMNYAWNDSFISAINQHGGGRGAYKGRAMQFIHPKGRSLIVRDGHRAFIFRDRQNGQLWSPGWSPVRTPLDHFECRHGLGYSVIESKAFGISVEARWFVPQCSPCEIWTFRITNQRSHPAELTLFAYLDFLLQGYTAYSDYYSCLWGEFLKDIHAVQLCNRAVERGHDNYDAFLASDKEPTAFDTSQRIFYGNFGHAYLPDAVQEGGCHNSLAVNENLVGALQHNLFLEPAQTLQLTYLAGASSNAQQTRQVVSDLLSNGNIEMEWQDLKSRKQAVAKRLWVETPISKVNYVMNYWVKQQIQIYADIGSDNGRGFRDAMQLLWASASYDQDFVRKMLPECLKHQFSDGHTLRGWLPTDDHHYSDGPVWIPPVVDAYLKETGDFKILDQVIPYFDKGEATVWEHLICGLRHSAHDLGSHGLVKCHFGDWNDSLTGVGIQGRGESVWTTIAIIYSCKRAVEIARVAELGCAIISELEAIISKLSHAVDTHAWDGQWYLRAINDFDEKIGTSQENEGYIYLLPQVWAILADIVDVERRDLLLRMIDTHLDSPYGSKTLHPPYSQPNPRIGRLSYFTPGIWENGSPYCHANGFKVIADCVSGRGDSAFTSFMKAFPDNSGNPSTHSMAEPYVFTNQYLGPENPRAGQTQFSWMTGAAGWYFRALTEWIIGVRADYNGLIIDPCLPSHWKTCSLRREFRGTPYQICIHNPHGIQKGKVSILCNGHKIEGQTIPLIRTSTLQEVDVHLSPRD